MTLFRKIVMAIALAFIVAHLVLLDYSCFCWEDNLDNYLGILAMVFVVISMSLSKRQDGKTGRKTEKPSG